MIAIVVATVHEPPLPLGQYAALPAIWSLGGLTLIGGAWVVIRVLAAVGLFGQNITRGIAEGQS